MSEDYYRENEDAKQYTDREKMLLGLVVVGFLVLVSFGVNRAFNGHKVYYDYIEPPIQTALNAPESFQVPVGAGMATVTKVAAYEVKAVVKSKKNYHDEMAEIIPMDVALAWNRLNAKEIDGHIKYSQSGRWYHYQCDSTSPVDINMIAAGSSNHHLFPATEEIRRAIKQIKRNDYVALKGYLVNVTYNGRTLSTSTSRSDQGGGACEIMLVTEVAVQ